MASLIAFMAINPSAPSMVSEGFLPEVVFAVADIPFLVWVIVMVVLVMIRSVVVVDSLGIIVFGGIPASDQPTGPAPVPQERQIVRGCRNLQRVQFSDKPFDPLRGQIARKDVLIGAVKPLTGFLKPRCPGPLQPTTLRRPWGVLDSFNGSDEPWDVWASSDAQQED